MTSDLMGFAKPYSNSLDAVSDRDFILEFLSNSSILMMHMTRICEEIINWCSNEFKFVTLSDTFSTGSSIMPQKEKPRYGRTNSWEIRSCLWQFDWIIDRDEVITFGLQ